MEIKMKQSVSKNISIPIQQERAIEAVGKKLGTTSPSEIVQNILHHGFKHYKIKECKDAVKYYELRNRK